MRFTFSLHLGGGSPADPQNIFNAPLKTLLLHSACPHASSLPSPNKKVPFVPRTFQVSQFAHGFVAINSYKRHISSTHCHTPVRRAPVMHPSCAAHEPAPPRTRPCPRAWRLRLVPVAQSPGGLTPPGDCAMGAERSRRARGHGRAHGCAGTRRGHNKRATMCGRNATISVTKL